MNVPLTRQLEHFIREKVASGMYKDAAEVVREALRMLAEQERVRKSEREDMRSKIRAGLRQVEQRKFVDGEKVFQKWETRLDRMKKRKRA